jgi:hypothetical protein
MKSPSEGYASSPIFFVQKEGQFGRIGKIEGKTWPAFRSRQSKPKKTFEISFGFPVGKKI